LAPGVPFCFPPRRAVRLGALSLHDALPISLEEGFRAHDPRFEAGVAIEALVRVTRLAVSIGLHTGQMTMDEAARRFEEDAHLQGDRKSTRLNSSHEWISYPAFCLTQQPEPT